MDAVFSPRLGKWALAQEGWHFEVERGEGGKRRVKASGVVYNEMKGVYSDADSLHAMACDAALFPDNAYSRSSGGDPLAITALTLERFTAFHRENYDPSRARLWFFGDDPEFARLELVHEYLEPFANACVDPQRAAKRLHPDSLSLQAPFTEPRWVSLPYPAVSVQEGETCEGEEEEEGEGDNSEGGGLPSPTSGPQILCGDMEEVSDKELSNDRAPIVRPLDIVDWNCQGAHREGYDVTSPERAINLPGHYCTVSWCLGSVCEAAGWEKKKDRGGVFSSSHPLSCETRLGLAILSHLLMGTQTATLRKALTDSGLGSSVTGGGYDDGGLQATFGAGLKGVSGENVEKVEALVLHTLTMIAGIGFEAGHVEASLNTVEFGLREFSTGGGPKGLSLFLGVAGPWVHGGDPIEEMRYSESLAGVKAEIERQGGDYFVGLLKTYLLGNPHRVTTHNWPDQEWEGRRDSAERAWLESVAESLDKERGGWERLEAEEAELKFRQSAPDREEDVAKIPTLTLADVDVRSPTLPFASVSSMPATVVGGGVGGSSVLLSSLQDTAGIGYLRLNINAAHVPPSLLPLLPLLSWGLTGTGSVLRSETDLARAIGANTGGLGASCGVWDTPNSDGELVGIPYLALSGKALGGKGAALTSLLTECLLQSSLARKERVTAYLRDRIARAETSMVSSGNSLAGGLLAVTQRGGAGKVARMRDVFGGLTALRVARVLLWRIESGEEGGWEGLVDDLHALRDALLTPPSPSPDQLTIPHIISASISDATLLPEFTGCAEGLAMEIRRQCRSSANGASSLHSRPPLPLFPFPLSLEEHARGLSIPGLNMGLDATTLHPRTPGDFEDVDFSVNVPASVNFVVKGGRISNLSPLAHPNPSHNYPLPSPLSSVHLLPPGWEPVSAFLRTGYLWERVRVSGGAYGADVSLNFSTGALSFSSYRDPHVSTTIAAFNGVGDALRASSVMKSPPLQGGESREASLRRPLLEGPILSVIGSMDAPLSPIERGDKALYRWMHGVSPELSQWWRDGVLGAGEKDVLALAEAADAVAQTGRTSVVGNGEAGEKSLWDKQARGGKGRECIFLAPLDKKSK